MTTVTKKDLVTAISGSTGVDSEQVALIVNAMLSTIGDKLAEGATITCRGVCTLSVKVAAAKLGRNPNAPHEQIQIPERCVVQFKPSKELKDRVEKLPPERLRAR
ncbi:MAG: HU family DNA-binding protein [Verrucomicrobiaceae bacterium]|nr:HU family DNA-binding protein [Verrucomicrobiaceae bacterium]